MHQEITALFDEGNSSLKTENANKDAKIIPTQRDLLAGIVSRHYALEHILPKDVAEAHISGDLHFHDLDYSPLFPMFNCMLIDVGGMLTNGFRLGNAEIESPKSISTATAVVAQIIAQVASHIYGGNTVDRLDEVLAPYVRLSYEKHLSTGRQFIENEAKAVIYAERMTEKECYDAFQGLEYEINTLHTANGQTPFCTFGFGLGVSWESRLIQKSILKVRLAGLGRNKKTAVFPKLVFAIRDGVNHRPGDCNYDIKKLALECASKRMYPDILNYDKLVEVTGDFKTPMGCRSFLGAYDGKNAGRNNLGVVSLNIPRIAIEAQGDEGRFWSLLNSRLELCRKALMFRIQRMDTVKAKVAPILYMEGACGVRLNAEDSVAEIFKNGRASISLGYIGLHEAAMAMFPEDTAHTFDSDRKRDFTHHIVQRLRAAVDLWKTETGYGFSLYSTPSESLCDRFCRLDVKRFGEVENVTTKGYYTNSFHLDVFKKVKPTEKIDFEKDYPQWASGGFISYVEFPNMKNNLKGLERVWDYTYDKLPYFGTNTPVDYCGACDYAGEARATAEGFECPACGCHDQSKLSVTRRVCGYLGSPNARPFNPGKQAEVMGRVKHMNPL
ncbi:anaerobic ribonucleoside-triphosphate reductase [Shewanella algae]|nr:anaerobic ribonucleoside-triphosphate reductase [Shewanella algae]